MMIDADALKFARHEHAAEVAEISAERDAWRDYAKALRALRAAERNGDAHAGFGAERSVAHAMRKLRDLGIDPLAD
jgi:hypothetical protein